MNNDYYAYVLEIDYNLYFTEVHVLYSEFLLALFEVEKREYSITLYHNPKIILVIGNKVRKGHLMVCFKQESRLGT